MLLALAGWRHGRGLAWLYCDDVSSSRRAFDFRVTRGLLVRGLGCTLVIGLAGGRLPAIRAGRLSITVALRAA